MHTTAGGSHVAVYTLIAGLAWPLASCGLNPREASATAPLAQTGVASVYIGDEYASAQRALQEKPTEASAPTF